MKKEYIKYEKLSLEIKKDIERLHNEKLKHNSSLSIEDSMIDWFTDNFDKWLNEHYAGSDDAGNKRRHFRLDIEIPITIIDTLIESAGDDEDALTLVGNVINISRGGLYFKYNRAIEVSSIIKVMIDLSRVDKDLEDVEALAMVVRCDNLEDEYGIGIMFSSIYDSDKENLETFIFKSLAYYIYTNR